MPASCRQHMPCTPHHMSAALLQVHCLCIRCFAYLLSVPEPPGFAWVWFCLVGQVCPALVAFCMAKPRQLG
ncbi:hypothetical protein COO60DRAFT_1704249 [Scenedesmus sp. NREL 46B-D3]|nr:hypothetical protein COO60DRAFT_1704249 [Scenedesmus sp. NREL 46B-D3]